MQRGSFSTLAHPFEVLTFLEKGETIRKTENVNKK